MKKKHFVILWVVVGAILLWLLWRNREKVAPNIFNDPLPTYLNINYPQMQMNNPALQAPISSASCGCNPEASKYLGNVSNSINEAQNKIEEQLKQYTDSMNAYFQTKTYS